MKTRILLQRNGRDQFGNPGDSVEHYKSGGLSRREQAEYHDVVSLLRSRSNGCGPPGLRWKRKNGLDGAMARSHLDRKNVGLAKLVYRLRQDIDVYRIIGINARGAKRLGGDRISGAFFGYVQGVAHESMALTTRKIFDREDPKKKFRLNSVSGVLARVDKVKFTAEMAKHVERFCAKHGNPTPERRPAKHLRSTVELFRKQHSVPLERLRNFRNQRVAHSEFVIYRKGTKPDKTLPSLDQFEVLFDFAADFYKLVSDGLLNIGPTGFAPHAGTGLVRMLKHLGLTEAKFDFPRKP